MIVQISRVKTVGPVRMVSIATRASVKLDLQEIIAKKVSSLQLRTGNTISTGNENCYIRALKPFTNVFGYGWHGWNWLYFSSCPALLQKIGIYRRTLIFIGKLRLYLP